MAKHRADEPRSFGTGERENTSPKGWTENRIEVDKNTDNQPVFGWSADGVEGYRDVSN